MENIDLTQKVPADAINYLGIGGMIIISALVVLIYIFLKRYRGRLVPLLAGLIGYIIFMGIGYNLAVTLLFTIPGMESSYEYNKAVITVIFMVIYVGLLTLGRIIFGKLLFTNYDQPGDVLNFGLGLGICDAVICAFSTLTLLIWASGINNTGMESLFKDFSEAEIISAYDTISSLFTSPGYFWVILGLSATIDIFVSCGMAILVYGVITKKLPVWWYAASAGMNLIIVLPFKLYDTSSALGILIPFGLKTIFFVGALFIIYKVDNEFIGGIIGFNAKNGFNVDKTMPKFGKLNRK